MFKQKSEINIKKYIPLLHHNLRQMIVLLAKDCKEASSLHYAFSLVSKDFYWNSYKQDISLQKKIAKKVCKKEIYINFRSISCYPTGGIGGKDYKEDVMESITVTYRQPNGLLGRGGWFIPSRIVYERFKPMEDVNDIIYIRSEYYYNVREDLMKCDAKLNDFPNATACACLKYNFKYEWFPDYCSIIKQLNNQKKGIFSPSAIIRYFFRE